MLGEMVGEAAGKVAGRRVLGGPNGTTIETSFEAQGVLLGVKAHELGTYTSSMRPDGSLYGEGHGVMVGERGEMGTWTGQGVGNFAADGSVSYRGAIYLQAATPTWSRLNKVALVFEFDVDPSGASRSRVYEWK